MNKANYKQCTTEIKRISKRKEFKGIVRGFKNIEEIREAYDYILINVFKKYNLSTEILIDEMETIWKNAEKNIPDDKKNKLKVFFGKGITNFSIARISMVGKFIFKPLRKIILLGKIPLDKILLLNQYINDIENKAIDIVRKEHNSNG